MVDFDKKIEDIISDYYNTIGKFNNVSMVISHKEYEINEQDDEEIRREKEGQQREILVDLGRIAEMALKYIIKIRRMELYPNEPYLDSNINGNIVKGFRDKETLSAAVVRDLGNKVHASHDDVESILSVSSVGPKAHDFNYLYLIINKLMPDVYNNLNEFMKTKIKSDNIANIFKKEEIEYPLFTVFPNGKLEAVEDETEEINRIREIIEKINLTIANSGDIFTRLRYYANNPFDKNYSIEEIYDVVNNIISFIKTVHLYNEKLDFNPEIAFSYYKLKTTPNLSKFSTEEITQIYSHNKINKNYDHLMDSIFYSHDLSFAEIMDIINRDDISERDYTIIFTNALNLETILYFRSIGIYDCEYMASQLCKDLFTRYSLEEYKEIRKSLDADKCPQIVTLLKWLPLESIKKLKQYPELLTFFIDEFSLSVRQSSYNYNDGLFNMLLSIEEVRENNNAWYGLDTDQLQIYWNVSKLLLKDPMNDRIINKRNHYADTIVENVKENIECFKNNPKMLCVMPLMLDCDDNQAILEILIRNGLNINDLRGFDSTIFCFPLKLVEVIEKLFITNKEPMIVNNKVNPIVMNMVFAIRDNFKSKINIPERRIPFPNYILDRKSDLINNPVINELVYDEQNVEISIPASISNQFKQIAHRIRSISQDETAAFLLGNSKKIH